MKNVSCFLFLILFSFAAPAQTTRERLTNTVEQFVSGPQMEHASLGIVVVNSETGEKVFELNPEMGLAPASCQKIITSATAMEILGPDYRYQTILGYDGTLSGGILKGNLHLIGSGDPSFGSWRYAATKNDRQIKMLVQAIKQSGIHKIEGKLIGENGKWGTDIVPGGWTWEDMGNYYGAGITGLNWHENQYDMFLRSGSHIGDKVTIVRTSPRLNYVHFDNHVLTAAKGSGDQSDIYLPPFSVHGFVRGTIPANEKAFVISGSIPDPALQVTEMLGAELAKAKLKPIRVAVSNLNRIPAYKTLYELSSPPLDSLNYWFMKKSINLYGEALVKTIAYEKKGEGSTEKGLEIVKAFWKENGIESSALHMKDGSGLSPANRITASALVHVLQYARTRNWFKYYYDALPEYNGMKLKSGTIGGVKSFAGYHTAKDGTSYTVAIIVNNYDGSTAEVIKKMFRVLDELK